jgi:hypothetical protein
VWILEDYGTDNWSLKHVVDIEELFGYMNINIFLSFVMRSIE